MVTGRPRNLQERPLQNTQAKTSSTTQPTPLQTEGGAVLDGEQGQPEGRHRDGSRRMLKHDVSAPVAVSSDWGHRTSCSLGEWAGKATGWGGAGRRHQAAACSGVLERKQWNRPHYRVIWRQNCTRTDEANYCVGEQGNTQAVGCQGGGNQAGRLQAGSDVSDRNCNLRHYRVV